MKSTSIKRARDNRSPAPLKEHFSTTNTALANLLGYTTSANVYYTDSSVAGLPALNAGVDKVANSVATMMTHAKTYDGGSVIPSPLVVSRPCPLYGSYEYYQMVVRTVMMKGNFVSLIATRDENGVAEQLVPIHPDAVDLEIEGGLPVYNVDDYSFTWDQVLHIRSHAQVGTLWGVGIVERYRKSLSSALYEQHYAETSYKSGGVPTAVVQIDAAVPTAEQIQAVNDGWITAHGGGTRKPAIVGKNMNITPLSWSPADSEFVESRKLSIAEAALICGLRPEDLGASIGGSGLTYGNRSDDALQRITDSYSPWLNLIEQGWSDLLPANQTVEGNPESLLRMSTRERLEIAGLRIQLGIATAEEIALEENTPS